MLTNMFTKTFGGIFSLLLLSGCAPSRPEATEGAPVPLSDASLLTMVEADSFTHVVVRNPWTADSQALVQYVLVSREAPMPKARPEGIVVRTPLQRVALTSAVHASLLLELGAEKQIAGLTDTAYVVCRSIRQWMRRPGVCSFGTAMQPDVEQLRASQADALWYSPFENAGNGSVDALGIPLIACADYMECSPLARAEWMKFYGRLMGKGAEADSLFEQVSARYQSLCSAAATAKSFRPSVICDMKTGGQWYVPGGRSTMGRFIADAGGRYLWADRPEQGSIPLAPETVVAEGREADIWLIKYGRSTPLSYAELASDSPLYPGFKAYRHRRVFGCNTLEKAFYEEVPFHPERLLRSLLHLFHPEVILPESKEKEVNYYEPIR